jgi:hypothetical protein
MAGPGKEAEECGGAGMPTLPPRTCSALAPAAMSALASAGRMPRGSRVTEAPIAPMPGEKRARAPGFPDAPAQGPRGHVSGGGTPQLPANPGASRRRDLWSADARASVQDRDCSVQGFGFRV